MRIELEINADLWQFISMMASDRAHFKGYSIEDMLDSRPQKDQILKWLREIQENKMRYRK